RFVFFADCFIK
ncbi:hypothetical protein VCHENC02_3060B, partial [Vibrio harveyi]